MVSNPFNVKTVFDIFIEDMCKDKPCFNGTCVNVAEEDRGFICACFPGYIGEFCEIGRFRRKGFTF